MATKNTMAKSNRDSLTSNSTLHFVEPGYVPTESGTAEGKNAIPPSPSGPLAPSLTEALQILVFLSEKQKLCTGCGYRWATWTTAYHSHCNDCRKDNMNYAPAKAPNQVEKALVERLGLWAGSVIGPEALHSGAV